MKIMKFRNDVLLDRYMNCKAEMMLDHPITDKLTESFGFHGTRAEYVESIFSNNFDERLGRPGYFGAGIYFARNFTKATKFATCRLWVRIIILSDYKRVNKTKNPSPRRRLHGKRTCTGCIYYFIFHY